MMLGAGLSIIFVQEGLINQGITVNAGHIIVMFIICIVSGLLVSGLAGALKAFFNIHEVVTTIMLN
jgi:simple sugar transport system permease protein